MKYQALFSAKDKTKKLKCRLLQFLFGSLWLRLSLKESTKNAANDNSIFFFILSFENKKA